MNPDPPDNDIDTDREAMLDELRKKYLAGTIDDALMPEADKLDGLLFELFPELAPKKD